MARGNEEALTVVIGGPVKVKSSMARFSLVEGGAGIGILPDFIAAPAIGAGALVRLFSDWRLVGAYADRTVHAVYSPTRH